MPGVFGDWWGRRPWLHTRGLSLFLMFICFCSSGSWNLNVIDHCWCFRTFFKCIKHESHLYSHIHILYLLLTPYVCIYYIYSYIYIINILLHIYIHTCIHTFIHTSMHTFIHSYSHTLIHSYKHTFIDSYSHTFIHSFIHTFIHSYIHTYNYTNVRTKNIDIWLCSVISISTVALRMGYNLILQLTQSCRAMLRPDLRSWSNYC